MKTSTKITGVFILLCTLFVFVGGFGAAAYAGSYTLGLSTDLIEVITSAPDGDSYNFGSLISELLYDVTPLGAVSDAATLITSYITSGILDFSSCNSTLSKLVHVFALVFDGDFYKNPSFSLTVNNYLIANPDNALEFAPTICYSVNELPDADNVAYFSSNIKSTVSFEFGDVVYIYASGFSDQRVDLYDGTTTVRVPFNINNPVSITITGDTSITLSNTWLSADLETYTISFVNSSSLPAYFLLDYYATTSDLMDTVYTVSSGSSTVSHIAALYYFFTDNPNSVEMVVYNSDYSIYLEVTLSAIPFALSVMEDVTIAFVSLE